MGLDIHVYRVIRDIKNPRHIKEFVILEHAPKGLQVFEKYSFFKTVSIYDANTWFAAIGLNIENYKWIGCTFYCNDIWEYQHKKTKEKILFINPPPTKKKMRCIAVQEKGYQRKGSNLLFGKHDKIDTVVTKRYILFRHWNKYFSDEDENISQEERRRMFKENIIDNFSQGEDYVIYH